MNRDIKSYVHSIVKQTDCTKEDYDDLFEELFGHVTMIRDEYVDEGYSLEEATDKAMKRFGQEAIIGNELQQSMFPYRRELLYVLGLAGFLLTVGMYVSMLLTEQVALHIELIAGMISHSFILFFAMNTIFRVNRRRWLNTALIIQLAVFSIQLSPASHFFYLGQLYFLIGLIGLILLTIFLLYRTALSSTSVKPKYTKVVHAVNITTGLIIIPYCIYVGLIGWGMGGEVAIFWMMQYFSILWLFFYVAQINLLRKFPRIVLSSLSMSVLLLPYTLFAFLIPSDWGFWFLRLF
ncbi:permease prefix domain 1-containing protein [Alkalicoccobacillus porphyridii]|uniref:Uncharacterized protein n=1 Tax=Alkalicoccobacillus porphyridii TaxID=2597270 RepID=A0A553ZXF3_9BACI|nr:permease prefix domain 1-containing protein [Alkalicoccobacillus porphyridii]TSB46123.1 hypothetical protein FN960_12215 [Alkalicoccobacillus porphyridii]